MKIGKLTLLKWTLFSILTPCMFIIFTNFGVEDEDFLYITSFVLLHYLLILLGFTQLFHFKKNELVIWYFNPFKKNIHISYESITKVEVFRGLSFIVINWFRFKTTSGEIIINNNIFIGLELKKIKGHFEKLNIDSEL